MLPLLSTLEIKSGKRVQMIDITSKINELLEGAEIKEGTAFIFIPHTTAGVTINENADPTVPRDILKGLERLVPEKGDYLHSEGNSDAHIKASLMGSSVMVIINEGRLMLGTWQGIFFCEFDGPRRRKVLIKIEGQP
ncbi:MAG: secondary thiamine-phosphate synthase enzyme YjbQ [Bacillota bacterium]